MLDEAVRLGCEWFGVHARVAVCVEWESYAAAVLLARMEEQVVEPSPIWCGDLAEFDARPWNGRLHILAAGLPCPAFSCAGKQLGNDDPRAWGADGLSGPIPQFLRIVAECRPAMVFIENVPPFVTGGWFRLFGERLSELGYAIQKPIFLRASDVGASHRRERVFIMANDPHVQWREIFGREPDGVLSGMGDAAHFLSQGQQPERLAGGCELGVAGRASGMGNSTSERTLSIGEGSRSRDPVGEPGGDVAEPASGRQRELREPPGCDGQPDGGDKKLVDSTCRGTSTGEQQRQLCSPKQADNGVADSKSRDARQSLPGGRDGAAAASADAIASVDDSRGARSSEPGEPPSEQAGERGRSGEPSGRRGDVGDADGERREAGDDAIQRSGIESGAGMPEDAGQGCSDVVGDAHAPGSQGTGHAGPERWSVVGPPDPDRPVFAPGPGDFDGWGRVVEDGSSDFLAPAVKPGVRVLADGLALVVDTSRADQLRCAGNGVVASQAAVAFIHLVREMIS